LSAAREGQSLGSAFVWISVAVPFPNIAFPANSGKFSASKKTDRDGSSVHTQSGVLTVASAPSPATLNCWRVVR